MKFLIIDDHPLMCATTEHVLSSLHRGNTVFSAFSGDEGLRVLDEHPDIDTIILDLEMRPMDGLQFLRSLRERLPEVPVLVLSARDTVEDVKLAIEAGAQGYCTKGTGLPALRAAIMLILSGELFMPALPAHGSTPATAATYSLSAPLRPRQRDILLRMCAGESNLTIGEAIGISEALVEEHIRDIFSILVIGLRAERELTQRWVQATRH
jgi:DNA-binding NarL/FixJ family response regulator